MNFKAGDKIKATKNCSGAEAGKTYVARINESGRPTIVNCSCGSGWELVTRRGRPRKEKPIKFIVKYDIRSGDPLEEFTSKAELNKWLEEARDNENIIFNSIKVYGIKEEYEVKLNFSLKVKKF